MSTDIEHASGATGLNDKPSASAFQLCKLSDRHFVQQAYLTLLRRKADPEGELRFTDLLRSGTAKAQILLDLHSSTEARRNPVKLRGLRSRLLLARLVRIPLVRSLANLGDGEYSNSRRARARRRFENEVERLACESDTSAVIVARLVEKIERLNARIIKLESNRNIGAQGDRTMVTVEQLLDQAE